MQNGFLFEPELWAKVVRFGVGKSGAWLLVRRKLSITISKRCGTLWRVIVLIIEALDQRRHGAVDRRILSGYGE